MKDKGTLYVGLALDFSFLICWALLYDSAPMWYRFMAPILILTAVIIDVVTYIKIKIDSKN